MEMLRITVRVIVYLGAGAVAQPAQNFERKYFDLKRSTLYCLGHCLSKDEMTK